MNSPIDVKLAIFFKKVFNRYIKIRSKPLKDEMEIKREIWEKQFSENQDSFEHTLIDDLKIILYKDSLLSQFIFFSFEEDEILFLRRFLKQGNCFFDIGANVGLFSLHAAPIVGGKGTIYSFEPTPETFDRFIKNIELNDFNNITPENVGLSTTSGEMMFNTASNGYDAWNSFAKLNELGLAKQIEVKVVSLDEYILQNKINKIDLVKLDVEGWEYNVLKGAVQLLSGSNSPTFMVEFTEENAFAAGYYCGEIYDFMVSFGYKWYSYNGETNTLIPQQKKLHYPYENLIATKNIDECQSRLTKDYK